MATSKILDPIHPHTSSFLELYRFECQKHQRASMVGSHLMRRRGQSLEFREFVPYTPGDDIRHVDWRASARYGSEDDLLVRHFVAEDQLTLAISVDLRESMWLPEAMPKVRIALWLAESLAWIASCRKERLILHSLFDHNRKDFAVLRGTVNRHKIHSLLYQFANQATAERDSSHTSSLNLGVIERLLRPTDVWVIISDLYFLPSTGNKLAQCIRTLHDGLRWIILVDLDSWPYEKVFLGTGPRRIQGPELVQRQPGIEGDKQLVGDIDDEQVQTVVMEIERHKKHFLKTAGIRTEDSIHWLWDADEHLAKARAEKFFCKRFSESRVLKRLFMKGS